MKTIKVTRGQYKTLQALTRKDLAALKKYPGILSQTQYVLRAYKKVIKRVHQLTEHANRRKRQTAYKRIVTICQNAIDRIEK